MNISLTLITRAVMKLPCHCQNQSLVNTFDHVLHMYTFINFATEIASRAHCGNPGIFACDLAQLI